MPVHLLLKNLPKNTSLTEVKEIFKGIKIQFIKTFKRDKLLEFKNETLSAKALKFNQTTYKNKVLTVIPHTVKVTKTNDTQTYEKPTNFPQKNDGDMEEEVIDTGRLFVRNLDFTTTEEEITEMFSPFGELTEVTVPFDLHLNRGKGMAFVTFCKPKDALEAYKKLNQNKHKTRKIHILPGKEKPDSQLPEEEEGKEGDTVKQDGDKEVDEKKKEAGYKQKHLEELKAKASSSYNWNALFINSDAVMQYLAEKTNRKRTDIFDAVKFGSSSVQMAQAEIMFVKSIRDFLTENDVDLDRVIRRSLSKKFPLYSSMFLVKNLPYGSTETEVRSIFEKFTGLTKVCISPGGVMALVRFDMSQHAKAAYNNCSYNKYKDSVLMMQWAPIMTEELKKEKLEKEKVKADTSVVNEERDSEPAKDNKRKRSNEEHNEEAVAAPVAKKMKVNQVKEEKCVTENDERTDKIVIKNVSFQSTKQDLEALFTMCEGIISIRVPLKSSGGHRGFAFVDFSSKECAEVVMQNMVGSTHLLGRRLVLEYSK